MKRTKVIVVVLAMFIVLTACSITNPLNKIFATKTPTATSTPTMTATPDKVLSITGTIGEMSDRMITLCEVANGVSELPAECVVYHEAVTSQSEGRFEFYNVPAGTYFVLYDPGDLDAFNEGMEKWSGKTLKLGDAEWLESEFYPEKVDVTIMAPIGTPMSWLQKPQYLLSYNYLALHGNGPFALAHSPRLSENGKIVKMIIPVIAVVEPGNIAEIKISIYKYSKD